MRSRTPSFRSASRLCFSLALVTAASPLLAACGDDDSSGSGPGQAGSGGAGGPSVIGGGGRGGKGGSNAGGAGGQTNAGSGGAAGKGGSGGKGGAAGKGGSGGKGGASGKGGSAGAAGAAGKSNWSTCKTAAATFHATAPKGTCDLEAALCLQSANGDAAATEACRDEFPKCLSCLDDAFAVCVIGTKSKPGVCRGIYGCYEGCVFEACPETPATDACIDKAAKGACATALEKYSSCTEEADTCIGSTQAACGLDVATCPEPEGSSATGVDVFTGSLFHAPNILGNLGAGCGDGAHDRVRAWTAPADGTYTFTLRTTVTTSGTPAPASTSHLILLRGTDCGKSTTLACATAPQSLATGATKTVTLVAGDAILVGASADFTAKAPTTAATYAIDITTCTPACDGKTCGPDGCGSTCGTCTGKDTCEAGVCTACKPACDGKTCGPDGCGATCGTCTGTDVCNAGVCGACIIKCDLRECGSDSCGGSCGTCSVGKVCGASGQCETPVTPSCDPVADSGCEAPESCYILSTEKRECALRSGTGKRGASCTDTSKCAGGFSCFANQCRAVCKKSGDDCLSDETCASVSGWSTFGTCAKLPLRGTPASRGYDNTVAGAFKNTCLRAPSYRTASTLFGASLAIVWPDTSNVSWSTKTTLPSSGVTSKSTATRNASFSGIDRTML